MPDHAPPRTLDLGPDRELVARLLAGEDDAWEDFRQRFLPRIGACVRRAGVWVNDLEDACSFVLEALLDDDYHRLRQWDGRASLSTYLYTVASRLAVDFIRQQPRVIFAGEDAIPHAAPVGPAVLEAEERALHAGLREQILLCGNQLFSEAPKAGRGEKRVSLPWNHLQPDDPTSPNPGSGTIGGRLDNRRRVERPPAARQTYSRSFQSVGALDISSH